MSANKSLAELLVEMGARKFWRTYGHHATALGQELAQRVLESGLSTKQLADRSGLNRSTISTMLTGRRGGSIETWDELLQIAKRSRRARPQG
jgi:DNA transposition AAA+ family ATPase